MRSEVAERLRAAYRLRVQQREQQADKEALLPPALPGEGTSATKLDVDTVRRQAREAWLQMRAQERPQSAAQRNERTAQDERPELAPRDDLAL